MFAWLKELYLLNSFYDQDPFYSTAPTLLKRQETTDHKDVNSETLISL